MADGDFLIGAMKQLFRASVMQSRRDFLVSGLAAGTGAVVATGGAGVLPTDAKALPIGQKAPQWDILEWINVNGGNVDSSAGKVIVIDFFQLWCPGCNRFSGPLLSFWQKRFAKEIATGQLHLVKIHTVFEGHKVQTVERLKRYVKEKKITLPVGVDRHAEGSRLPETMKRYKTMGTPEMAVIDKQGIIRFQKFGFFEPEPIDRLIQEMMKDGRA